MYQFVKQVTGLRLGQTLPCGESAATGLPDTVLVQGELLFLEDRWAKIDKRAVTLPHGIDGRGGLLAKCPTLRHLWHIRIGASHEGRIEAAMDSNVGTCSHLTEESSYSAWVDPIEEFVVDGAFERPGIVD